MQTLVISDLHLGAHPGRPSLDDPATLEALIAALADCDRLVLLGDILELRERPLRDAVAAASRVLPQLAGGFGGGELILLQGNHDHQLLAPWFARRRVGNGAVPLEPETDVDWVAGEPLAAIAEMLSVGGARLRVAYPGVWLRNDVYAHHGHYLDRLTTSPGFERLAAGAMGKMLRQPPPALSAPVDYERALAPIYAWMHAITETGGPEVDASETGGSTRVWKHINESSGLRTEALKLGVKLLVAAVSATGIGPLSGDVTAAQLCRASLEAYGQVLAGLGLEPAYALFGHTHRAGPLPDDELSQWVTPAGVRLFNSGCWVHEGAFAGPALERSPYRAGFALELDDDGPPRLVNILER